jgi:UDP-glucose 4-epimerase
MIWNDPVVLIPGGTGTFGNAVTRRLLARGVREIRVFSRDEEKQNAMRQRWADPRLKFYLGDVRHPESLADAMTGVDFVFHAAALKQVPSCEFFPVEALRTNSLGTENVLNAAIAARVARVIVLSTDKAVYPINVMGMSKALMEKIAIAKSRVAGRDTTICCLRYGNVMGSRGSVLPLFIRQIRERKPLTITNADMTRFMLSIDGALDLLFWAFEHGNPGDLFVQKAGAATIGALAAAVKEVFDASNPIQIIGTRHGEKMHETLLTREEMAVAEDMGGYYRVAADGRDLNYGLYVDEGRRSTSLVDYNSENARRLSVADLVTLLHSLPFVQEALAETIPA